jgi:hypothetical protein
LDNGSVAAFAGAFAAYLLVVAADRMRGRKRRTYLTVQLANSRELIRRKRELVKDWNADFSEAGLLHVSQVVPFCVGDMSNLAAQISDAFRAEEKLALDAILFELNGIDAEFDEARSTMKAVAAAASAARRGAPSAPVDHRLSTTYKDLYVLLGLADRRIERFLAKDFGGCLELSVNKEDLEVGFES